MAEIYSDNRQFVNELNEHCPVNLCIDRLRISLNFKYYYKHISI